MNRSLLLVAFSLLALAAPLALSSNQAVVGQAAPAVTLTRLADGGSATLDSLEGRPGVLEFWATWCPPCRKSIPHLIEVRDKYPEDKLAIWGITDEPADKITGFVEQMKMNYTIMIDPNGAAGGTYGCDSIPRAFVVDAKGVILWEGNPLDAANFDAAIEQAIASAGPGREEVFAERYAALTKGEGAEPVAFTLQQNGGKKPTKRFFKLGADRKASVEVVADTGTRKTGETEFTEKDLADLVAALKAADFSKLPKDVGAGKPEAVRVKLTVEIGEGAGKSVEFVADNGHYAAKGTKTPDKLATLWKKLDALAKKAEAKAK